MGCAFTPDIVKRIGAEFAKVRVLLKLNKVTIEEAHDLLLKLLKSYSEIENPNDLLVATVQEVATRYGFLGGDTRLFPLDMTVVRNIINDGDAPKVLEIENGKDIIEEEGLYTKRKDAKIDFLNITYGHATQARAFAEQKMAVDLVDSIIVDRKNGEVIDTPAKLNKKIREHQESLFKTIVDFLKDYYATAVGINEDTTILDSATLYSPSGRFNQEAFDAVRKLAEGKIYLKSATRKDWTTFHDNIQRMFQNRSTNPKDALKLDAIAAMLFLYHYDAYLDSRYGKALSIKDFGKFTGEDKYGLADKGENNITTHRDTEDIDVGKEIPNIVYEFITTTPLYINGVKTDSYLKVSDLSHAIGVIKDLVFGLGNRDLVFTTVGLGRKRSYFLLVDNLSESTVRTLTTNPDGTPLQTPMTISKLSNLIRLNPLKYLSALMEVLSNEKSLLYIATNNGVLNKLIEPVVDIINSLHIGVFNSELGTNEYSLNAISKLNPHENFYGWVTQTCDSIFKVKYLLYYKNLQGDMSVRDMSDSSLDSYIRTIKHSIKTARPARLNDYFDKRCVNSFTANFDPLKHFKEVILGVRFGGKDLKIHVPRDGKNVLVLTPAETHYTIDPNDSRFVVDALAWINSALNQNLDPHLLETLAKDKTKVATTLNNLIEMAARTTMLLYVSTDIINKAKLEEGDLNTRRKFLLLKVKEVLGEDTKQNIDRLLQELDVIHANDLPMLEALAKAYAIEDGMYSSSLIKNGEGSAQSQYTLSRLLGSLTTQIEVACKHKDAAMVNSMLVNLPGLFRGVYTAREFYDIASSKDHTKFNVSEFAHALLLYDFVGGLAENSDPNGVVGNGVVAFIPSVNSDKNTIGRILIDTNLLVQVIEGGQYKPKRIRDLSSEQFELLIERELGTIYDRTYLSIINDFAKLYSNFTYTDYIDGFKQFNATCAALGVKPVDKLKADLLAYNKIHLNDPVHLIDQVHFIADGKTGNLLPNKTLLSYLYRYKTGPFEHPSVGFTGMETEAEIAQATAKYNQLMNAYSVNVDPRNGFVDLKTFWQLKRAEITKSLIDSGFKLDLINPNPEAEHFSLRELNYLKNEYFIGEKRRWVDLNTGNIIIAKFNSLNITTKEDIRDLDNAYKAQLVSWLEANNMVELALKLEAGSIIDDASYFGYLSAMGVGTLLLNPLIDSYNYLNYLFTLEFMISTVGSCIAHPGKGEINSVLQEEAARYQAQHKRNVSYTAAMQEFQLGMLNGIPSLYNIAIIDDIKDVLYNVLGDIDPKIKPYDGATYVNPFVVHWENASLGGAKAGITKKLFVHYYDSRTGTGGIIKTCGFGLTNDWINNSVMLLAMMKQMTSRKWLRRGTNELFVTDITKDYTGKTIDYGPIYFKGNDNHYYHITRIESIGNNRYRVFGSEVKVTKKDGKLQALWESEGPEINISHALDLNKAFTLYSTKDSEKELVEGLLYYTLDPGTGNYHKGLKDVAPGLDLFLADSVEVSSNYDLWQLFGGRGSLELNGKHLIPSERSILNVVKASNLIGEILNNDPVETLDNLYLPLKHSDIHYCPTAGAIKLGAANINGREVYGNFDADLNSMIIDMNQAGILLDKEHHADGTELSLMTLVINACSHLGYSADDAMLLYHALRTLTDSGTAELVKPFELYLKARDREDLTNDVKEGINLSFKEAVINSVVRSLSREKLDESSLLQAMASELIEKARNGELLSWNDIKGNLPIDNSAILNQFLSKIAVFMTTSGIKAKIPGILSVLTPSHEIFKIYDGLKIEEIENNAEQLAYEEKLHQMQDEIEADSSRAVVYTEVTSPSNDRLQLIKNARTSQLKFKLALQFYGITAADLEEYKNATLEDYVASNLSKGSLKRGDSKTSAGIYRELGIHTGDISKFKDLFNESTGLTVDAFVHQLWENLPNPEFWDTEAIKGALLSIILSAENMESLRNYSLNSLVNFKELEMAYYNEPDVFSTQTNLHNLRIGRTYKIVYRATNEISGLESGLLKEEYVNIDTPVKRAYYRDLIRKGKIYSMVEWIIPVEKINPLGGRNLGSYDVHFFGVDGEAYTLYDFDSTRALFELKDIITEKDPILQQAMLDTLFENYKHSLPDPRFKGPLYLKFIEKHLRLLVRRDTAAVSKNGSKYFKRDYVIIDGNRVQVDKSAGIKIIPYELALPKIKIEEFGLETYDSLNEIERDPEFFVKRSLEHFSSTIADEFNFDIELKRINGKHLYILDAKRLGDIKGSLTEVPILKLNEDGKILRIDDNENILHQLASETDRIFRDSNGVQIIVTEHPNFYIKHENYSAIRLSNKFMQKNADGFRTYLNAIRRATKVNKVAGLYYNYINNMAYVEGDENNPALFDYTKALEANSMLALPLNFANLALHPAFEMITKAGRIAHTSFLKSLEIVGSRTPSLSMQSFMPMRIAAFDNPNRNTAFVSTALIWLLGSDYDVDAVSIAAYEIDKGGLLLVWTPYVSYDSLKDLETCMEFDFPTGKLSKFKTLNGETEGLYNTEVQTIILKKGLESHPIVQQLIDAGYKVSFATEPKGDGSLRFKDNYTNTSTYSLRSSITNPDEKLFRTWLFENKIRSLAINSNELDAAAKLLLNVKKSIEITTNRVYNKEAYERTKAFYEKYVGEGKLFKLFKLGGRLSLQRLNNPALMKEFIHDVNVDGFYYLDKSVIATLSAGHGPYTAFSDPITGEMLSLDDIKEIQNELIRAADHHNMYLEAINRRTLESIAKNYAMYLMYNISADPINAQQSQSSVDAMTGPIQKIGNASPTAMIVKYRTAGNFVNTAESIVENLVGKEGIGICATGMKAYFGLTAYTNYITNYGTEEQKQRLRFNVLFGGKLYTTIANINALLAVIEESYKLLLLQLRTVYNNLDVIAELEALPLEPEYAKHTTLRLKQVILTYANSNTSLMLQADLLESYLLAKTTDDAALALSAMLSLATDNAKELQLSKLNAGTKTIGMYLYGLTIGIPFLEIATRMMSPIGNIIIEVMSGNSFTGLRELRNLNDAFDYLEIGPKQALLRFLDTFFILLEDSYGHSVRKPVTISKIMIDYLRKVLPANITKDVADHTVLAAFAWSNKTSLEEKINFIDSIPLYNDRSNNQAIVLNRKWLSGLMKNIMKHYIYQINDIKNNKDYYDDIATLAEGALEMRVQGSFFSLNLGLKSKPDELKDMVSKVENCIVDRIDSKNSAAKRALYLKAYNDYTEFFFVKKVKAKPFDLMLFTTDPNYAALIIKTYERVKHTFNILDSLTAVPHFNGYLSLLAASFGCDYYTSPKFRFSYNYGAHYIEKLGIGSSRDKLNVYKGLNLFYSDYVRRRWMQSENITITLPAQSKFIDDNGNISTLQSDTPINLGTKSGEATFKMYMETLLIPALKHSSYTTISENLFIKRLVPSIMTKTVSHNPIVYYSLPINMMPHGDTELAVFDSYKAAFNLIANQLIEIAGKAIPLRDLFFYYGLIAHYGKPGQQSLMPIFLNVLNVGTLRAFHEYESNFNELIPTSLESEIESYVIPYVGSLWSATASKVYAEDPKTLKIILWERLPDYQTLEGGEYDIYYQYLRTGAINGYTPIENKALAMEDAKNYLMSTDFSDTLIEDIDSGFKMGKTFVSYKISYDAYGNCLNIACTTTEMLVNLAGVKVPVNKPILINLDEHSEFKTRPTIKKNGLIVTDIALIETYLKHLINCG